MGPAPAALATETPRAAPGPRRRLLVLEDDGRLRRSYCGRLRAEGHAVDEAATLAEARASVASSAYDCLVLDRKVPGGDALALVDELYDHPDRPPILLLSGLGGVDERMRGLCAGADDYVAKPVHLDELAARVGNLVRRRPGAGPVRLGRVVVDRDRRRVAIDGREVHLTPHQLGVLEYLVANRHRLVTTEELLEHCWDGERTLFANPLHSQVTRLRRTFRGHLRFDVVRGAGYLLRVEGDGPAR